MIELTSPYPWHPEFMTEKHITSTDYAQMLKNFETRYNNLKRAAPTKPNLERAEKYFLCPSKQVLDKTLENTTAVGTINTRFPMRQHYQSRNPLLQRRRFLEGYATDTWFSTVTSYEGYNCTQHFVGLLDVRSNGTPTGLGLQEGTDQSQAPLHSHKISEIQRSEVVPAHQVAIPSNSFPTTDKPEQLPSLSNCQPAKSFCAESFLSHHIPFKAVDKSGHSSLKRWGLKRRKENYFSPLCSLSLHRNRKTSFPSLKFRLNPPLNPPLGRTHD